MTTIIDAVYENGVFRPLGPVALTESQQVRLSLEAPIPPRPTPSPEVAVIPRLTPPKYPDDDSTDSDEDYESVPPKIVGVVHATVVYAGRWMPPKVDPE